MDAINRNEAQQYGVTIVPALVLPPSTHYWKAVLVRKLKVGENGGRHAVFIDVFDENGAPCRGKKDVLVAWGWEGQRAEERATPKQLDKPEGEPMAVVDLYPRAKTWVQLVSDDVPCERVQGITSALPDEVPDVTYGHHSFYVRYQKVAHQVEFNPPVIPDTDKPEPQPVKLAVLESVIGTRLNEAHELIMQDLRKIGFA